MQKVIPTGLFVIANYWKQPKCPYVGERLNKLWYFHLMEYWSTMQL